MREGEPIAISYLSRSLKELGCEVSLLVLNTSKHYFNPAGLPEKENHFEEITSIEVNNEITISGAIISLLKGDSYILSRFYSKRYELKLTEILKTEQYDVVHLETIYMAHYIPAIRENSMALIALRTHNVEHEIWRKVALTTKNIFKKWYLLLQNSALKKFEVQMLNRCDILAAITKPDLDHFVNLGFRRKGIVAPVGINLNEYQIGDNNSWNRQSIAFIGALDWMPNQHGIIWFLENVWPSLSAEFPEITLHIAGKNTPEWLMKKTQDRVIFHGEVPDAKAFINQHPILIAPLFSGSGIKIKVLEGLALGRLVVTTEIGAEGIPAVHGKELMIANTPHDFIIAIHHSLNDINKMKNMGMAGRSFIRKNFDNLEIAESVKKAYQD